MASVKSQCALVENNNPNPTKKDEMQEDKPNDLAKTVEIVVRTWKLVEQDLLKHGVIFYKRLFTEYPEVISFFPFTSDMNINDGFEDHPGVKKQALKLMRMITWAVNRLDNLSEVVPELKKLGKRHSSYKVKPEHYKPVGECLLWTLEHGLGEIYTHDVEEAWTALYGIITNVMIEGGEEH